MEEESAVLSDKGGDIIDLTYRFPEEAIIGFQKQVEIVTENRRDYSDRETVESFEKLGTAFYYNGDYNSCIAPFTTALDIMRDIKELSRSRCFYKISILLSLAHFRLGQIQLAEKFLTPCTTHKSVDYDLQAIACSNMAWLRIHQNRLNEACDRALVAVETAAKAFAPTSPQYLRCIRVQLIAYLKCGDFTKADILLEEVEFPSQEKVLLRAACWMSMGMSDEAIIMLREESFKIAGTQAMLEYQDVHNRGGVGMWNDSVDSAEDADMAKIGNLNAQNDPDYDSIGRQVAEQELLNEQLQLQRQESQRSTHRSSKSAPSTSREAEQRRLFNALVLYNLSALYFRQRIHQHKALQTINDAINEMRAYIQQIDDNRKHFALQQLRVNIESLGIQFLERPGSMPIPYCISIDELTPPMVILSHLLTSRAEIVLNSNELDSAVLVQSGYVFTDDRVSLVNNTSTLFQQVQDSLEAAKSAFTHEMVFHEPEPEMKSLAIDLSNADINESDDLIESRGLSPSLMDADRSKTISPASVLESARGSRKGTASATEMSKSTNTKASVRETTLEFNIWSAPADELPQNESLADLSTVDIPRKNFDQCGSEDVIRTYEALLAGVVEHLDANGDRQVVNKKAKSSVAAHLLHALNTRYGVCEDSATGKLVTNKQFVAPVNQYISSMHDFSSVRAEVLPILNSVGRDDATCWVQWALNQTNGFGLGFMGQGSLLTSSQLSDYSAVPARSFSSIESCSKQQLEFIRERLLAVDKKLQKKFDDDRKYKGGDREKVLILNAVLAKVTAQLALRKETGLHVKKMEEVMKLIYANSDRLVQQQLMGSSSGATSSGANKLPLRTTVYDPALAALVKRFRLDFEEWDISEDMISSARKKINKYLEALKVAKEYVNEAEASGDIQLRRDSIKKICNLYIEIIKAPMSDPPKEQSKGFKNRSSDTPDNDEQDEGGDDDPPPTESQLAKFSEEAIEEFETEDPLWVKRFGSLRALHFASRLAHFQVE